MTKKIAQIEENKSLGSFFENHFKNKSILLTYSAAPKKLFLSDS